MNEGKMKGFVLWWDYEIGRGSIEGVDGIHYAANHNDVRKSVSLYAGEIVLFEPLHSTIGAQSVAKHIEVA